MAESRMPLELQIISYEFTIAFGMGLTYLAPILST